VIRVAVMGCGSWGTTFGMVLAEAGASVTLWGRRPEVCAEINAEGSNTAYLPGVRLHPSITADADPALALAGARIVVLAVPAQTLRQTLTRWRDAVPPDAVLVSLMKGIELGSHRRMSQVISEVTGAGADRVAVVSGPNLATEIVRRQPTATVVACADPDTADLVAHACWTPCFRPYTNVDVLGVELGGAVKNVIALAVGIAEGMGYGDNTKATLITRGLAETTRLGLVMGADPATFAGLAGLGDLVATCASPLSRNRTFGVALGRGLTVEQAAAAARHTVEGVQSCGPILELARGLGVEMPITAAIVAAVHGGLSVAELGPALLERPRKPENV
jgi:glycerol-3-phosphate dehydrogenase (NAD(P)+)